MRLNTLDNEKLSTRKNINQKLSFPNIFNLTINTKPNPNNNISSPRINNSTSSKGINNPYSLKQSSKFHLTKKLRNEINFVHMLNLEDKICNIITTDLNLKKQKLKIDNNILLKKLRLGINKKKEEEDNDENNKNNDNNINKAKDKDTEDNIEKMENNLKDAEHILEKKLEEKKMKVNVLYDEYKDINDKLNKIYEEISENKMDEKILMDYAEVFDNNYEKKLNENLNEHNNYMHDNNYLNPEQYQNHKNGNNFVETTKKRQKEIENINKLKAFRQKREEKKTILRDNIVKKEKLKSKLESELISKKNLLVKAKEELAVVRNKLINRYHIKLYQGITFHNEGLPSIIKDIWKLNGQVNTNFMPSYLDSKCIKYIFQKASQSIEITKLRQSIKEAEDDFLLNLEEWKKNANIELSSLYDENPKKNKFFNLNKKDENKNATFDENELFKTKISDISISYLDNYPKTKQFIIDYRKNHPQKFKKEMPKLEFKTLKFRSLNIPNSVTEKNKKIERLKYLLEIKLEQYKSNDKREVERLNKEFIMNNYQEKYNVNVETLFGALFGDKKNEMLIHYARLEKDYRDNKKIIRFHTKNNGIKLK